MRAFWFYVYNKSPELIGAFYTDYSLADEYILFIHLQMNIFFILLFSSRFFQRISKKQGKLTHEKLAYCTNE